MNINSIINHQELTPKQKAILLFWQNTKGTFKKEPITVQDQIDNYLPIYSEGEIEKLATVSWKEAQEFYQWDHFIRMVYIKDLLAQKYYYQMVGNISTVVCGLPYILLYGKTKENIRKLSNLHFDSLTLGEDVTYEDEVEKLYYCCYNFLMITHATIFLNHFADNAYDPLPCTKLLQKLKAVNTISTVIMGEYMTGIDTSNENLAFPSMQEFYSLHNKRLIADSLTQFDHFTKPFEQFGIYVPESLRQKYLEETNKVFD